MSRVVGVVWILVVEEWCCGDNLSEITGQFVVRGRLLSILSKFWSHMSVLLEQRLNRPSSLQLPQLNKVCIGEILDGRGVWLVDILAQGSGNKISQVLQPIKGEHRIKTCQLGLTNCFCYRCFVRLQSLLVTFGRRCR